MRSTPLTIGHLSPACAVLLRGGAQHRSGRQRRGQPGGSRRPASSRGALALHRARTPARADGHIVGNTSCSCSSTRTTLRLPPASASTAVNFGVVAGDVLFANEPRAAGSTTYCPKDHGDTGTITADQTERLFSQIWQSTIPKCSPIFFQE